jgi:hypothetical protein
MNEYEYDVGNKTRVIGKLLWVVNNISSWD